MARFFIDRPIFAWVIAILIMVAGAISVTRLPISRYPTIAPPSVTINASYPGASARAVEDAVTQVIEQNMKGLDGLIYMSATSEASGRATITAPPPSLTTQQSRRCSGSATIGEASTSSTVTAPRRWPSASTTGRPTRS